MPRLPITQNTTYVYKFVCRDTEIKYSYVGHTTNFNRRRSEHHSQCTRPEARCYNMDLYKFMCDNGGWGNFDMILIENRKCNDTLEAKAIERG